MKDRKKINIDIVDFFSGDVVVIWFSNHMELTTNLAGLKHIEQLLNG